jgi:hypothetical protein
MLCTNELFTSSVLVIIVLSMVERLIPIDRFTQLTAATFDPTRKQLLIVHTRRHESEKLDNLWSRGSTGGLMCKW